MVPNVLRNDSKTAPKAIQILLLPTNQRNLDKVHYM